MLLTGIIHAVALPLAASGGGEDESSNFLVSPDVGLMIWTVLAFLVALFILRKYAFPQISAALEKRQHLIEESIDSAERTKAEADEILAEYRERLKEARVQAEEIVTRARKNGEAAERAAAEQAAEIREEQLERARKDIQAETARALQEIRREVADLTVAATERVTRKTLNEEDQRRLVEDALSELDFSALGERR
ncbi:MAG TPA: F0F1 ATP synthase subunit B [Baekduia sp.]|uniref:F0F1 ATP synthase subunit B n=1 Tax=Baekduia sp. TaxID=2600305 RepID=UPI002D791BE5|nr:F0F1 ATP synthase subunit B [Baekduia sp.]HET6506702.1 F0F1 ATP synthase subunit B [Baekduia sp.]